MVAATAAGAAAAPRAGLIEVRRGPSSGSWCCRGRRREENERRETKGERRRRKRRESARERERERKAEHGGAFPQTPRACSCLLLRKRLCQKQREENGKKRGATVPPLSVSLRSFIPADEPLRRVFSSGEGVALEKISLPSVESRPILRRGGARAGWSPPSRNDKALSPARASDVSVACPTAARSSIRNQ